MRIVILSLVSLLPSLAFATIDPRNTPEYRVLFDLEAHGKSGMVDGYGAYVQIYENAGNQKIRFCENFDGGTTGHPNPARTRLKLLPIGTIDPTAYRCRDFSLEDVSEGQALIKMGERSFFAMKSAAWTAANGGEILFQLAKKIPLLGSPTYRTIRIRGTRSSSALDYRVETVIPRAGVIPSHFYFFDVSGSGLGIPNGITGLTVDRGETTEKSIELDNLEGPIDIRGGGKSAPRKSWPTRLSEPKH